MQPIEIIEIDQDFCTRTYGTSPCDAALGVTGAHKCFNTIGTCQALAAYDGGVKTLKFCTNQENIPPNHLPFLVSVSTASAEINPGGANKSQSPLGKRATLSASFLDAPSTDRAVDKYAEQRRTGAAQETGVGYNPEEISTFWRKWKARNKYYLFRPIRYITALIDDNGILHNVRTRHYVLTSFSGPDTNGRISIGGKDILELLSRDKAEAPFVSQGKLKNDITDTQTSAALEPSGIGAKYPASGKVAIGKEICNFARSGDNLTLTRGRYETERKEHKAGDTVQLCLEFNGQNVRQICETLLKDYAKIPLQFLDVAGWQAEVDAGYLPHKFTALIAKPEKALDLIGELMEQGYFYIWFDEILNKVRMRAVRKVELEEVENDIVRLNHETNFIADSISISDKPDQIITRVVVNYGMINPLENAKEGKNFSIAELIVDLENEDDDHARISNTKTVYSRWMHAGHGAAARDLGERLLDRYKVPPVTISFSLAAKDAALKLADYAMVKSPYQTDAIGYDIELDGQIIKAEERKAQHQFDYVLQQFAFERAPDAAVKTLEISGNMNNVNLLSYYNSHISAPLNPNDTLNVIIRKNVIIGSTSVNNPAFYVPNFGVQGLVINLVIEAGAYVVGRGGDGGGRVIVEGVSSTEKSATKGGDAIKSRHALNIDNSGTIGGGGGGGGYIVAEVPMGGRVLMVAGGGGAGRHVGGTLNNALPTNTAFVAAKNGSLTSGGKGGYLIRLPVAAGKGNGGDLGQAGVLQDSDVEARMRGGAAGKAVDGNSYITWVKQGTIKGARVN